jgi:phosphoadenosine phosphosulfate reductase
VQVALTKPKSQLSDYGDIFLEQKIQESITNIQKFAKIAKAEGLVVELGFSGGKDSIVCYDLCKRSGIDFISIFKYAFEDPEVVNFIKVNYPDVQISRKPLSYFQLIKARKFLPTNKMRFCCDYFKENSRTALITGVRKYEGRNRATRKTFSVGKKRNIGKYLDVFSEQCTETKKKATTPIVLRPIVNWQSKDVWAYIRQRKLKYPSLYDQGLTRCGCMMCPLAGIKSNMFYLRKYPNILPSFYKNVFKHFRSESLPISSQVDFKDQPIKYLLYWLASSYRPTKASHKIIDQYLADNPHLLTIK